MATLLAKNADVLVTMDGQRRELRNAGLFARDGVIEKVGPTTKRAEGYLRTYVKLAQRLDNTLARFKLTSFGKPADGAGVRKPVANPWAAVAK